MKKQILTIIVVLLLTVVVNIGDLKCQEDSTSLTIQYSSEYTQRIHKDVNNKGSVIDDKNIGLRILEMIIKRNINQRYQTLYTEELEDMLEQQQITRVR